MNIDVKAKWIDALRSGDYAQGAGALRLRALLPVQYCCLGVLCELYAQANNADNEWDDNARVGASAFGGDNSYAPLLVRDWAGISDEVGLFLAGLNDSGRSFDDIAKWIEEYL